MRRVRERIAAYDFSPIRDRLVASVPGRHSGASIFSWGHMGLRRLLEQIPTRDVHTVVAQFSSLGSLGKHGLSKQRSHQQFRDPLLILTMSFAVGLEVSFTPPSQAKLNRNCVYSSRRKTTCAIAIKASDMEELSRMMSSVSWFRGT